jgi:hypothetical protein
MAALTGDAQRRRKGQITEQVYQVAANAVIYYNAIVALDASGYLVPAADTAGLDVVGIADEPANNTGGANGALEVRVYRGAALIATTGASKLVQADVGGDAFILDDNTVVKTAGTTNNVVGGEVLELANADAVWVNFTGKR